MLLNPFILEGIIKKKLDEYSGAEASDLPGVAADHKLLDLLNKVVELGASELSMDNSAQALKSITLHCKLVVICCDDLHEGLDLNLRQVLVDRVVFDQLSGAFEQ